ncbi:MAG: AsmA-like C-terminal domain-containing protein, partial [Pseudomonadota bacterium]
DTRWATLALPAMSDEDARRYGKLFDFSLSLKNLYITNGKIFYRDDASKVTAGLDHVKLTMKLNRKTGYSVLSAYAAQPGKDSPGRITLDSTFLYDHEKDTPHAITGSGTLSLTSLSLRSIMPLIKSYAPFMDPATLYDAELTATLLPEGKITAGGRVAAQNFSLCLQDTASWALGPCSLDFSLQADPEHIACDKFLLSLAEGIIFKGNLSLANLREKGLDFDVQLNSHEVSLPAIKQRLSACPLLSEQQKNMLQRLHAGKVTLKNIQLKGNLNQQPEDYIPALKGDIAISNAAIATFENMPPLIISEGLFKIHNDALTGDMKAQWLAGDNHTLHTEMSSLHRRPGAKITVNSKIPSPELNGLISLAAGTAPLSGMVHLTSGYITAQTTISYAKTFHVSSELDLTRASYGILDMIAKPEALSNTLTITLDKMPDTAKPEKCAFTFSLGNALTISGSAQSFSPLSIEGSYAMQAFDSSACNFLSPPKGLEIKGRLTGTGTFSFPPRASARFPLLGSLAIDDFEIREPEAAAPFITGRIATTIHEQSVSVHSCAARFGDTYGTFNGELESLLPPQGKLKVTADFFDIDDFVNIVDHLQNIPDKKAAPAPPAPGKNIFLSTSLDMDLTIKKLNFLKWDFDNGTCRYIYKNGSMLWDGATLAAGNGTISGSVLFDFSQAPVRTLTFMPARSNVEFLWAVPALQRKKSITGRLDLKGEFSSTFSRKTEIADNMKGTFRADVTGGIMKRFTTLSKILSMLNISRIIKLEAPDLLAKGMPFDFISSDLTMEHGVMKTDNLILKGPAMNLSAVGTINLVKEEIDLIVGAQILETIGKIIGTIPVAGEFFTGKDKALTLGYFHAKGP